MPSLQDVGATLAIGLFAILGLLLVLDRCLGLRALTRLQAVAGTGSTLMAAGLAAASFGVGILLERTSDYFATQDQVEVATFLDPCFPDEEALKIKALVGDKGKLTELGTSVVARLALDSMSYNSPLDGWYLRPDSVTDSITPAEVYYLAKSQAFTRSERANELQVIQLKIDFMRSLMLGSLGLCWILVVLAGSQALYPGLAHRVATGSTQWQREAIRVKPALRRSMRPLPLLVALVLTWVAARTGFAHEELEFNKRVLGYFAMDGGIPVIARNGGFHTLQLPADWLPDGATCNLSAWSEVFWPWVQLVVLVMLVGSVFYWKALREVVTIGTDSDRRQSARDQGDRDGDG